LLWVILVTSSSRHQLLLPPLLLLLLLQGVLSLSDRSLTRGSVKHLTVSGFTRLDPTEPRQTLHALVNPTTLMFSQQTSSSSRGMGSSNHTATAAAAAAAAAAGVMLQTWHEFGLRRHSQDLRQQRPGQDYQGQQPSQERIIGPSGGLTGLLQSCCLPMVHLLTWHQRASIRGSPGSTGGTVRTGTAGRAGELHTDVHVVHPRLSE